MFYACLMLCFQVSGHVGVSLWLNVLTLELGLVSCITVGLGIVSCIIIISGIIFFFFFFFFCVPQLYLWGSPLLGEIFAYVTVF